jgi:hypothetical protein
VLKGSSATTNETSTNTVSSIVLYFKVPTVTSVFLSAYPNPYNGNDAVKLSLASTSVGTARLRVSDLLGREVASQTFTTVNGATEVIIDQAAKLSMGTYMAQVTLPSGEVKTIRIQKR